MKKFSRITGFILGQLIELAIALSVVWLILILIQKISLIIL